MHKGDNLNLSAGAHKAKLNPQICMKPFRIALTNEEWSLETLYYYKKLSSGFLNERKTREKIASISGISLGHLNYSL